MRTAQSLSGVVVLEELEVLAGTVVVDVVDVVDVVEVVEVELVVVVGNSRIGRSSSSTGSVVEGT
jgi:hypothetical protein